MGRPIHSTINLLHGRRATFSNGMIQLMIIKSLTICIFGRVCGSQIIMENMWRDLTILWSDKDNSVGRPKC